MQFLNVNRGFLGGYNHKNGPYNKLVINPHEPTF